MNTAVLCLIAITVAITAASTAVEVAFAKASCADLVVRHNCTDTAGCMELGGRCTENCGTYPACLNRTSQCMQVAEGTCAPNCPAITSSSKCTDSAFSGGPCFWFNGRCHTQPTMESPANGVWTFNKSTCELHKSTCELREHFGSNATAVARCGLANDVGTCEAVLNGCQWNFAAQRCHRICSRLRDNVSCTVGADNMCLWIPVDPHGDANAPGSYCMTNLHAASNSRASCLFRLSFASGQWAGDSCHHQCESLGTTVGNNATKKMCEENPYCNITSSGKCVTQFCSKFDDDSIQCNDNTGNKCIYTNGKCINTCQSRAEFPDSPSVACNASVPGWSMPTPLCTASCQALPDCDNYTQFGARVCRTVGNGCMWLGGSDNKCVKSCSSIGDVSESNCLSSSNLSSSSSVNKSYCEWDASVQWSKCSVVCGMQHDLKSCAAHGGSCSWIGSCVKSCSFNANKSSCHEAGCHWQDFAVKTSRCVAPTPTKKALGKTTVSSSELCQFGEGFWSPDTCGCVTTCPRASLDSHGCPQGCRWSHTYGYCAFQPWYQPNPGWCADGLSPGGTAGIALAVIALLGLSVGFGYYFWKKKKAASETPNSWGAGVQQPGSNGYATV